jgi:Ca-activated chloride channel family protein
LTKIKLSLQKLFTTLFILVLFGQASAQYYIRGDVKDQNNEPLQNVKIYRPSTHSIYYSGVTGGFGIPSSSIFDSLILSKDGYVSQNLKIKTTEYQSIIMKMMPVELKPHKQKLISLTTSKEGSLYPMAYYNGESYSNLIENDFIKTNSDYETTFSMRIDKAS